MSSEMRELVRKAEALAVCVMAADSYSRDELRVFAENFRDEARTLLARTEAGADGSVGVLTVRRWRGIDAMVNHEFEYLGDLPDGTYSLFTRPQDASGDAEAAYAILDRLTTTREGCMQLAKVIYRELDKVEKLLDEAVEKCAAMQAKEAK